MQIGDRVAVDVGAEIIVVAAEGFAQAMIEIEHAGDAIEAEAVEAKFFQPVAQVAQQEALDFVFAVIEQQRIPGDMLPARAGVEILIIGAVEKIQALPACSSPHGCARHPAARVMPRPWAVSIRRFQFFGRAEAGD